jgi:hypothetical protein
MGKSEEPLGRCWGTRGNLGNMMGAKKFQHPQPPPKEKIVVFAPYMFGKT